MLKNIVTRILKPRHYWRDVAFDELSELYISIMLRGLSISLTGLFVPIFMLRLGYDASSILMVNASYFTTRIGTDLLSAYAVARFGPKHTMLIGYLLQIVSSAMFLSLPSFNWPVLLLGVVWGSSASFFFIPFHVDFSKIKHRSRSGSELGYMHIMERIGATLGPIVGGLIATIFVPQLTFLVAIFVLILAVVPLMSSAEPVRVHQHLRYDDLPVKRVARDAVTYGFLGIENSLTVMLWPLFIGLYILLDNSAYARLGIIASASVVFSIVAAKIIGKLIDKRQGRTLLRFSVTGNALLHIIRPLVSTYPGAFVTNIANEVLTSGYRMPYFKGMYDAADDLPGHRIAYISFLEAVGCVFKAAVWWLLVILLGLFSQRSVMILGFFIAATASMLIATERYRALNTKQGAKTHG